MIQQIGLIFDLGGVNEQSIIHNKTNEHTYIPKDFLGAKRHPIKIHEFNENAIHSNGFSV